MKNKFTIIIIAGLILGITLMWYGIKFAMWVLYMMLLYPYHTLVVTLAIMVTGFVWDKYHGIKQYLPISMVLMLPYLCTIYFIPAAVYRTHIIGPYALVSIQRGYVRERMWGNTYSSKNLYTPMGIYKYNKRGK